MKLVGTSFLVIFAVLNSVVPTSAEYSVTSKNSITFTSGATGGSTWTSTSRTKVEEESSTSSTAISSESSNGDTDSVTVSNGTGSSTTVTSSQTTSITAIMEDEYYIIMQRIIEIIVLEPGVEANITNIQEAVNELLPAYNDLVNSLYTDDCERYVVSLTVTHWEIVTDRRRQLRGSDGEQNANSDSKMAARKLINFTKVRVHITITGTCTIVCTPDAQLVNDVNANRRRRLSDNPNDYSNIPTLEELRAEHALRLGNDTIVESLEDRSNSVTDASKSAVVSFNGGIHEAYIIALKERAQVQIDLIEEIEKNVTQIKTDLGHDNFDFEFNTTQNDTDISHDNSGSRLLFDHDFSSWYSSFSSSGTSSGTSSEPSSETSSGSFKKSSTSTTVHSTSSSSSSSYASSSQSDIDSSLAHATELEQKKAILEVKLDAIEKELEDTQNELPLLKDEAKTLKEDEGPFEQKTINREAVALGSAQLEAKKKNKEKAENTDLLE